MGSRSDTLLEKSPGGKRAVILEVAVLDVRPGQEESFQQDFQRAQRLIQSMEGYCSHELQRSIERRSRFILLVRWETLEDHIEGFRNSPEYQEWKILLHHYYDPFPDVEHYESVLGERGPDQFRRSP